MKVAQEIKRFMDSMPEPKSNEMQTLHQLVQTLMPECKLWYEDGKNDENKTVANPTIGYGLHTMHYANGTTKDVFQIGLSANQTGISIYVLGLKDKTYLAKNFGTKIGKAKVTGYCIRFKTLKDINMNILEDALKYGIEASKN